MDKLLKHAELSGSVVIGGGIQYPRTANVYIGDDKNGYQQGDLADVNATLDIVGSEETRAKAAEKVNADNISNINSKIPSEASASNQLADKAYVNSGIATNSATFRGTYNSVEDLEDIQTVDNNDYAFVETTDQQGNTTFDRYKYVEGTGWAYEFSIENTEFTQEQFDAINSGINSTKVGKLDKLAPYDGEYVEVNALPTPSDATMGKVYMIPANPNIVVTWDWQNQIPVGIRNQWVEGDDATGNINSDIAGIVLNIGTNVPGTRVKFSTNGGLDNVQVNGNTFVHVPVRDAGDIVHIVTTDAGHAQYTINGTAVQSEDVTYTATLADAERGYVELISTGYCNFYRIVATYTHINKATSTDSSRNTMDKYITVLENNTYKWEQLSAAYVDLDNYYTKEEVDDISQDLQEIIIDNEHVTAAALNDLDERETTTDKVSAAALNDLEKKIKELQAKVLPMEYEAVDMGLPSGTLWANKNVGASNPADGGLYFTWGSTEGFDRFSDRHCYGSRNDERDWSGPYGREHGSELGDTDNIPANEYFDAARKNMGGSWKMPTKEQFEELFNSNYTTNEWVENYKGTGMNGCLVTSNANNNTLFFPGAGMFDNNFNSYRDETRLWTSDNSSDDETYACNFYLSSSDALSNWSSRYYGYSVRGVRLGGVEYKPAALVSLDVDGNLLAGYEYVGVRRVYRYGSGDNMSYVDVGDDGINVRVSEVSAGQYACVIDESSLIPVDEVPNNPYDVEGVDVQVNVTGTDPETSQLICDIQLISDSGDVDFQATGARCSVNDVSLIDLGDFVAI